MRVVCFRFRRLKWLGLFLIAALLACRSAGAVDSNPDPIFESDVRFAPVQPIDRMVHSRLQQLRMLPGWICSDAVFVRRVYLDVIGTLPTAQEAKSFIQDSRADKRRILIDQLLQRDEFADYWAMKWCDLLRVKSEFPINLWPNAVQGYYHWIHAAIRQNMPMDRFARELLTSSGSNFRVPQVNFYRAVQSKQPETLAKAVALTFMGERAEHWPKERLDGMAGFFIQVGYKSTAEWKEEIVFFDPTRLTDGKLPAAVFPDGTTAKLSPDHDPREDFAGWLLSPKNPRLARNLANRSWFWLLGRGIVHEPDDIRPENPPVNPELLGYLERELISHRYDMKHLFRLILNSQTYQLSCIVQSDSPAGDANFSHYPLRRLEAEVLVDALCQISGTNEKYISPIPEPFTYIPESMRSICLADASITSAFLEMFGRSSRDSGLELERNNRPSAAQRLHLLNSSHIQRKIEQGPKMRALTNPQGNPQEMVTNLYLTILSRYPTDEELKIAEGYNPDSDQGQRAAYIDLAWALINSPEFLHRH